MNHALYDENDRGALFEAHPFHDCAFLCDRSVFRYPAEVDVSVIVPCYNAESFLPECIRSLASQEADYAFEVILIDDGSTDGTGSLVDKAEAAHERFRCFHQENQGAAAARNLGMREARGEYLLFVDADDVVSPNYVQALLDCVKSNNADIGVCAYYSFSGDGVRYKSVQWGQSVTARELNGAPWGKLFRRDLFDRLLWPSGYWYEDTVLAFLVYPRARRVACTNQCEYGYRSSMQNATHTGRKSNKALDSLYITHLTLKAMDEMGLLSWLDSDDGRKRLIDQFYLNQCRVCNLPEKCREEVFRLQSAYARQMPQVSGGRVRADSPLYALALKKDSMALGSLAVKLEKPLKALRLISHRAAALLKRREKTT